MIQDMWSHPLIISYQHRTSLTPFELHRIVAIIVHYVRYEAVVMTIPSICNVMYVVYRVTDTYNLVRHPMR